MAPASTTRRPWRPVWRPIQGSPPRASSLLASSPTSSSPGARKSFTPFSADSHRSIEPVSIAALRRRGTPSSPAERGWRTMGIDVLKPETDGYEENRGAFNVLLSQEPAAIVTPHTAGEVADAIDYAKAEGLRVGAQRTGHAAEPLGDLSGTLLIRTAALNTASSDAERRVARVGAGALWGDLVPRASEIGLAACHGSSPTVGIVGYSLGGGVGWYGRKHGLQCNRVTAIELVDATGTERRVDAVGDAELFWAMRGAGGDFGVVTA